MFPIPDTGSEMYFREYVTESIGGTVIKDALSRLDRLTQEAIKTATVSPVKHQMLIQRNRVWLSPPDPSTNHNIASHAQHEGTATWFFEGSISEKWKSKSTTPWL